VTVTPVVRVNETSDGRVRALAYSAFVEYAPAPDCHDQQGVVAIDTEMVSGKRLHFEVPLSASVVPRVRVLPDRALVPAGKESELRFRLRAAEPLGGIESVAAPSGCGVRVVRWSVEPGDRKQEVALIVVVTGDSGRRASLGCG
jgi:hypothetical protein